MNRTSTAVRRALAVAVLCVSLAAFVAPSFAGASSPTQAQYQSQVHATFNGGGNGSDGGSSGSGLDGNVGPLPFTGFDVLSMAAVALAVTGAGLLLQRAVSRRTHEDVDASNA
jgi:hypothetical protein